MEKSNDIIAELNEKNLQFSNKIKESKDLVEKLEQKILKIQQYNNDIETKKLIVSLEDDLVKFPSQAIGSINLYNKLNEKFNSFNENQFNKIIRFVHLIEENEKAYRKTYVNFTETYIQSPHDIKIDDLYSVKDKLNKFYMLLGILVKEVDGDLVLFNKVYNQLEDAGFFMSVPEKVNQEYLSQISKKLSNVMEGLSAIFKSLEESNILLRNIRQGINETNTELGELNASMWDVSWELSNK
tara:strand:- start:287 stop:1009 length:723 start_codon:yes stop_codon:yes gene_type:complete